MRLDELGVPRRELMMGMCGIARVRRLRGGMYEPHPLGSPYLITPVRASESIESAAPASVVHMSEVIDLIAWLPDKAKLYQRSGAAEYVGAIRPQWFEPDQVRVWRSLLGWLKAGCEGLVLLGDQASRYRTLTQMRAILAEDAPHAAELQEAMQLPLPKVRFHVERKLRRVA